MFATYKTLNSLAQHSQVFTPSRPLLFIQRFGWVVKHVHVHGIFINRAPRLCWNGNIKVSQWMSVRRISLSTAETFFFHFGINLRSMESCKPCQHLVVKTTTTNPNYPRFSACYHNWKVNISRFSRLLSTINWPLMFGGCEMKNIEYEVNAMVIQVEWA